MHQETSRGSSIPIRSGLDTRSLQLRHILGRQLLPPKYPSTRTHHCWLCLCEGFPCPCRGDSAAKLLPLCGDLPGVGRAVRGALCCNDLEWLLLSPSQPSAQILPVRCPPSCVMSGCDSTRLLARLGSLRGDSEHPQQLRFHRGNKPPVKRYTDKQDQASMGFTRTLLMTPKNG